MATISSLCVYCGSRFGSDERFFEAAEDLGRSMGEKGIRLIYGGGRVGLMGVVADAALKAGGDVVGIIPEHLESVEVGHHDLTELIVVDSMHTRKARMSELSDGFVVLPGGLGTLDETFEIVTWKQLGLHDKPIVIADLAGFWQPLEGLIEHLVTAEFADVKHARLASFAGTIDEVFEHLEAAPEPVLGLDREHL